MHVNTNPNEPLTKENYNVGIKGHIGVKWVQPEVKLPIFLPNLVRKTPDLSATQIMLSQRSHIWVIKCQPNVKLLRDTVLAPNLINRTFGWSELNFWVKDHAVVIQG